MLLKRVELKNFCQHDYVKHDFQPGLIGIMGPCGSGKSNFVQAIKASLTNDFKFKGTSKVDKIMRGSDPGEPSFVRTRWRHGSSTYSITRGLRPSTSKIKNLTSGVEYSKNIEIKHLLQDLMGISPQVVDDYVFVDQWKMFQFLSEKPSERKYNFAQLCGVSHLENLWDMLGKQIAADRPLAAYYDGSEVETRRQLREGAARIKELQSEIETYEEVELSPEEFDEMNEVKAGYEAFRNLRSRMDAQLTVQSDYNIKMESATEEADKAAEKLSIADQWLKDRVQIFEQHQAAADRAETVVRNLKKVERLQAAIQQHSQDVDPPEPPPHYQEDESPVAQARSLQEALNAACDTLAQIRAGNEGNCPTCGQSLAEAEDYIKDLELIETDYPVQIARLEERQDAVSVYRSALRDWQSTESARIANFQAAEKQLKEFLDEKPDLKPVDTFEAEKFLKEYDKKRKACVVLSDNSKLAGTKVLELNVRLAEVERVLNELRKEIEDVRHIKRAEWKEACEALTAHEGAKLKLAGLRGELKQLQTTFKANKALLPQLKARKEAAAKAAVWIDKLESYREVVHRDNLPKIYMQAAMEKLTHDVNANLADFGSPFRVAVSADDLSFTIINRDGTTEPAAAKSGGESVVLAVAYRLAVSSRFTSGVNFMVLDEPSAGLDDHYLGCLADVLQSVNEVTRKKRQQVILITHNQGLERVFDQLVKFE